MQEVKAYKSNSGELFDTADEAKAKDMIDSIIEFMTKDDEGAMYISGYATHRRMVIEELSRKIVKDAAKFRAIFDKVP